MKKKRLVIVRVNSIVIPADKQEQIRKQLVKQIKKDGVMMVDKSCTVECYDYDSKTIEVKVVNKDDELITQKKD